MQLIRYVYQKIAFCVKYILLCEVMRTLLIHVCACVCRALTGEADALCD